MSQQPPPPPGRGGPWQGPQRRPRPQTGSQRPPQVGSGSHGPRKVPPPTGDRPTEFIPRVDPPRVDSTTYIPKVEDYGGYPTRDPDGFRAHRGNIADLDPDGPTVLDTAGVTSIMDPVTEVNDLDTDEIRDRPPVVHKETGRTVVRTVGEVLITLGMVVLLFVVYELYITNIFAAQKQANATSTLDKEWDTVTGGTGGGQRTNHYDVTDGQGFAKLYIPALGRDFHFTVIEGVTQPDLAIGPGHYPGTALPGQPGNMAIAGHRVGEGAPFDDLGLVQSCDAIVVETQTDWYVYRMLPMAGEVASWATTKGRTTQCAGPDGEGRVNPLTGLYATRPSA